MPPPPTPLGELDAATIIALERGALDRWGRGDPGGYLEVYPPRSPTSIRCSRPGSMASTR